MKKFIIALLIFTSIFCLNSTVSSKWKDSKNVNFRGQMGKVKIELSSYSINLSEDPLAPGWSDSFSIDVTNTGSLPITLSYSIVDAPLFLIIKVKLPGGVIVTDETASVLITISIPEDTDQSFEDTSADFIITFIGTQL